MSVLDPAARIHHAVLSRLKMRQLALLQTINRLRALNRVAAELRLSQPAITKALREIEDIFGAPLFERSSRGLKPTAAGEAVLRYSQRWLADLEATSKVLAAIDAGHGGRIRLGMTTQVPQQLLSAALQHLIGQRPQVSVFVAEGTTDQLVGRMLEQEPCLVVAARNQKRLSRGPLDWAKLAQLDWILPPPNTPMRRLYNTIFVTAGVQPPFAIMETISVRSMETVLVSQPNAIAILPRDVVDELFKSGDVAPLAHRLAWRLPPVTFFCQAQLAAHEPMRALASALRDAAKRMAAPRGSAKPLQQR
jgi:DNA-binding transcriptional LysR family regulator